MKTSFLVLLIWFAVIAYVQAEPQIFSSTDSRTNLIELYTSEGCSSCPPADKWLSQFKDDELLWKEFIPVAFHVDYWNYIGWADRFSSPQYGQRQRDYAAGNNLSAVYTPGLVLNGKEWRLNSADRTKILSLDRSNIIGKLKVGVDGEQLMASFTTTHNSQSAFLNIAVLGFDLITVVEAGENRGRKLQHDFVVLAYKRLPMDAIKMGYAQETKLPERIETSSKLGVAVWIDHGNDLTPIQATGGWLATR